MRDIPSFLGLARRAGKLVMGEQAVLDAAERVRLIMVAKDLAAGSHKRAMRAAETANAPLVTLPHTKETLGAALGRGTCGILALTDEGFAREILKVIDQTRQGASKIG